MSDVGCQVSGKRSKNDAEDSCRLLFPVSHLFADTRNLTPETYFGLTPETILIRTFVTILWHLTLDGMFAIEHGHPGKNRESQQIRVNAGNKQAHGAKPQ